ncbi:putative hairy/enhancer-of-split related with YRPW motif protein isoform X2 [Apostichopus japonicus]|uniref:Putative hairy/enhancer-of-split related with YRPW motif protein isoform X2 n=1 Tax=Stichopus japonicus TaxID=307972 RepID=A0A2G8LE99_STIJA|nr:putative hairy/enhancer-of-split related with YRPW motif protein isoform X2 [Apostichopus japonicus]
MIKLSHFPWHANLPGSKVKETPSHSSHSNSANDICWESALEGYVTGYKDCSQEAVRYLLEEEGLTPTDQIVVGLRNHLRDNEVVIDNNNRRSAESLVGQTLVCFNSRGGETSATQSPTSLQQLPPIHELISTSVSAFPTSSSSSSNSLPQGSMTALTLTNTPGTMTELTLATTSGKTMEPLTVDTNQEYELPSPLQRGAEAAKKSKESLLTIAHTQPTISRPVYTQSIAHQLAPVAFTTQSAPLALSCATQRLGLEKAMATSLNTVGGQAYGFNLNYAAPYVYAWVKPAQQ